MNRRLYKILIPSLALLIAIGFLVFSGVKSTGMSYITVKDLVEGKKIIGNEGVRLDGKPIKGSVQFIPKGADGKPHLIFDMSDVSGSGGETKVNKVKVIYVGLKPDSFIEEQPVMVEGKYNSAENAIIASKLLTKCPSRYEASKGEGRKAEGEVKDAKAGNQYNIGNVGNTNAPKTDSTTSSPSSEGKGVYTR